jgi:hypothetical protein
MASVATQSNECAEDGVTLEVTPSESLREKGERRRERRSLVMPQNVRPGSRLQAQCHEERAQFGTQVRLWLRRVVYEESDGADQNSFQIDRRSRP